MVGRSVGGDYMDRPAAKCEADVPRKGQNNIPRYYKTRGKTSAVVQLVDKRALTGRYSIALAAPRLHSAPQPSLVVHHRRNTTLVAHI